MNFMDEVSKRIVELREAKGETQQELADAIGITRQSLSRYEIAVRTINVDVLGALAQHFEVSTDYLLGLSDVKSTEQDMKIACEVTGLSEKAVEKISDYSKKSVLSSIFETAEFFHILTGIRDIIVLTELDLASKKIRFEKISELYSVYPAETCIHRTDKAKKKQYHKQIKCCFHLMKEAFLLARI